MSSISVAGDVSGAISIAAPSAAGSGVLTLPTGTDTLIGKATTDTLTNKSIAATQLTGTIAAAALPAGSVLQVVSTTKTDTFSVSTPNFVDVTGLSVSITPSSASNKILVHCGVGFGASGAATHGYRLVRDSTAICIADAASLRPRLSSGYLVPNSEEIQHNSVTFLDSPATTSATTYKIQAFGTYSGVWYLNRSESDRDNANYDGRTASTITVMEIKG
jgi:hypothetical protein